MLFVALKNCTRYLHDLLVYLNYFYKSIYGINVHENWKYARKFVSKIFKKDERSSDKNRTNDFYKIKEIQILKIVFE